MTRPPGGELAPSDDPELDEADGRPNGSGAVATGRGHVVILSSRSVPAPRPDARARPESRTPRTSPTSRTSSTPRTSPTPRTSQTRRTSRTSRTPQASPTPRTSRTPQNSPTRPAPTDDLLASPSGTSWAGGAFPGPPADPGARGKSRPGLHPPGPRRSGRPAARRQSLAVRRRLARRRLQALAVAVAAVVVTAVGVANLTASPPALTITAGGHPGTTAAGMAPTLPWPATGGAALAVPAAGVLVQSGPEAPVPVASLTKMMTAYLVLRDHPLAPTAQGPVITMTASDLADAAADEDGGDTSVPVTVGERLTERQLLDGLIVHSANNFADTLARWDAGSVAAFVAKMNATADRLGMRHTHYVDTNGIDAGSVSTAADQLRLAGRAMALPAFAAVADQPVVDLPLAGELANYVSAVGQDGVVGIKSGFTQAAMGCLVLAADRQVDGRTVLVLAAVTGQPGYDPLGTAQNADLALVDAAPQDLARRTVVAAGTTVASVHAKWSTTAVPVRTGGSASLLVWDGSSVRTSVTVDHLRAPLPAGSRVGTLTASDGSQAVSVPLVSTGSVAPPGMAWRLLH